MNKFAFITSNLVADALPSLVNDIDDNTSGDVIFCQYATFDGKKNVPLTVVSILEADKNKCDKIESIVKSHDYGATIRFSECEEKYLVDYGKAYGTNFELFHPHNNFSVFKTEEFSTLDEARTSFVNAIIDNDEVFDNGGSMILSMEITEKTNPQNRITVFFETHILLP